MKRVFEGSILHVPIRIYHVEVVYSGQVRRGELDELNHSLNLFGFIKRGHV